MTMIPSARATILTYVGYESHTANWISPSRLIKRCRSRFVWDAKLSITICSRYAATVDYGKWFLNRDSLVLHNAKTSHTSC
jgi:hypothetical protein